MKDPLSGLGYSYQSRIREGSRRQPGGDRGLRGGRHGLHARGLPADLGADAFHSPTPIQAASTSRDNLGESDRVLAYEGTARHDHYAGLRDWAQPCEQPLGLCQPHPRGSREQLGEGERSHQAALCLVGAPREALPRDWATTGAGFRHGCWRPHPRGCRADKPGAAIAAAHAVFTRGPCRSDRRRTTSLAYRDHHAGIAPTAEGDRSHRFKATHGQNARGPAAGLGHDAPEQPPPYTDRIRGERRQPGGSDRRPTDAHGHLHARPTLRGIDLTREFQPRHGYADPSRGCQTAWRRRSHGLRAALTVRTREALPQDWAQRRTTCQRLSSHASPGSRRQPGEGDRILVTVFTREEPAAGLGADAESQRLTYGLCQPHPPGSRRQPEATLTFQAAHGQNARGPAPQGLEPRRDNLAMAYGGTASRRIAQTTWGGDRGLPSGAHGLHAESPAAAVGYDKSTTSLSPLSGPHPRGSCAPTTWKRSRSPQAALTVRTRARPAGSPDRAPAPVSLCRSSGTGTQQIRCWREPSCCSGQGSPGRPGARFDRARAGRAFATEAAFAAAEVESQEARLGVLVSKARLMAVAAPAGTSTVARAGASYCEARSASGAAQRKPPRVWRASMRSSISVPLCGRSGCSAARGLYRKETAAGDVMAVAAAAQGENALPRVWSAARCVIACAARRPGHPGVLDLPELTTDRLSNEFMKKARQLIPNARLDGEPMACSPTPSASRSGSTPSKDWGELWRLFAGARREYQQREVKPGSRLVGCRPGWPTVSPAVSGPRARAPPPPGRQDTKAGTYEFIAARRAWKGSLCLPPAPQTSPSPLAAAVKDDGRHPELNLPTGDRGRARGLPFRRQAEWSSSTVNATPEVRAGGPQGQRATWHFSSHGTFDWQLSASQASSHEGQHDQGLKLSRSAP